MVPLRKVGQFSFSLATDVRPPPPSPPGSDTGRAPHTALKIFVVPALEASHMSSMLPECHQRHHGFLMSVLDPGSNRP